MKSELLFCWAETLTSDISSPLFPWTSFLHPLGIQVVESSTCRSGAAQLGVEGFPQEEVVSVGGGGFGWRTGVLTQVVFSGVVWVSVGGGTLARRG